MFAVTAGLVIMVVVLGIAVFDVEVEFIPCMLFGLLPGGVAAGVMTPPLAAEVTPTPGVAVSMGVEAPVTLPETL
jgi:hypothetical protein